MAPASRADKIKNCMYRSKTFIRLVGEDTTRRCEGGRKKLDKSFSENEIFMIFNHKRAGGERERVIRGG